MQKSEGIHGSQYAEGKDTPEGPADEEGFWFTFLCLEDLDV